MTSDPYQAYPSSPTGAPPRLVENPAVELIAAGPVRQRRLTVAFRLILCVPHAFLLSFLNLAGVVVAFLGWWGALFMGRLPGFAVTYLSGLARWNARYYGYRYLLTDDYPPFKFDDDLAYPVVIAIPPPGRLNRFAVFFRLILAIWANIVSGLLIYGVGTIVAFIAWLITLFTGRLPGPLHLAFTAVLRFQTRYACYLGMLTPTYPWKLFGDEPDPAAPAYGAAPGYETTLGYGAPVPGYGTPGGYGSALPVSPPASWRLVLPLSARVLLLVFIILGLITEGGLLVVRFAAADRTSNALSVKTAAISEWNSDFKTLKTNLDKDPTSACGPNLGCLTKSDAHAAMYFSTFANEVQAITMPSAAAADATTVVTDARKASQDFTQLSSVTDIGLYNSTYAGTGLAQELQTFQQDLASFGTALANS